MDWVLTLVGGVQGRDMVKMELMTGLENAVVATAVTAG